MVVIYKMMWKLYQNHRFTNLQWQHHLECNIEIISKICSTQIFFFKYLPIPMYVKNKYIYLVNVIYRHISTIHKPKMHTTMGFWNRKPMESMMHIILQKGLFKSWNSTVVENDMFCQRQLFGLSFQICRVSDFTVQNFHKGPSIIYG